MLAIWALRGNHHRYAICDLEHLGSGDPGHPRVVNIQWAKSLAIVIAESLARVSGCRKGGLGFSGPVAFMTVVAVLMVLAVLGSALPSFCLSYKIRFQEATVQWAKSLAIVYLKSVLSRARKP